MNDLSILSIVPVEFRLDLKDPFIVTAHHIDHFPAANAEMRPQTAAKNKEFNMYYGDVVPGFSEHPHTGFETITLVEQKAMSIISTCWEMLAVMRPVMCNG